MKYAKKGDGLVSRYINRRISGAITDFIVKRGIPITPNMMTAISTIIGIVGGILLPLIPPLGGLLVQTSSILDGVDGELARALNRQSKRGGFIDTVLDRIVDAVVIYGAWMATFLSSLGLWAALTGSLMVSYVHSVVRQFFGIDASDLGIPKFASRDVRLFIIFLGSLFYGTGLAIALTLVALASFVYVTLLSVKVWKTMK